MTSAPWSERINGRFKDEFGGGFVRVRGAVKVKCQLMFGILALTVDQKFPRRTLSSGTRLTFDHSEANRGQKNHAFNEFCKVAHMITQARPKPPTKENMKNLQHQSCIRVYSSKAAVRNYRPRKIAASKRLYQLR